MHAASRSCRGAWAAPRFLQRPPPRRTPRARCPASTPTPRSPSSPTPPTTSGCTGSRSAPTSTPSCTPSATGSTPSAAGAGATRRGAPRRSSRRTAWSRPGSGSATATSPPTWCAPRCSTPATRSREVTEALCRRWRARDVRLLPMTDDRVETHVAIADPDSAQRPPGRALPGVLGPAARRGAGRGGARGRARGVLARPRRDRRDHRRRPRRGAAEQPGGQRRHDPRRPRRARGPGRHPRAGGRPLPHRRRHPRARHGPPAAHRDRRRGLAAGGRAALRRPLRRAACSTAGWSTPSTPADVAGLRDGRAGLRAPCRC